MECTINMHMTWANGKLTSGRVNICGPIRDCHVEALLATYFGGLPNVWSQGESNPQRPIHQSLHNIRLTMIFMCVA